MKDLKGILAFDGRGRVKYQPGDIVGVRGGKGPITWLSNHCVVPQTNLFHFFLIGDQVGDDYEILESIGKGVAVGRLSWYKDREYTVFRVNHEKALSLGASVFRMASKFGRRQYDWKLYVKIFAWALGYWLKEIFTGHIPPWPVYPTQIPYKADDDFICVELVFAAWKLADVRLRKHGHAPVPAEVILAQDRGDLFVIDQHDGKPANWREHKSPLYSAVFPTVVEDGDSVMARGDEVTIQKHPKPGPDLIARQGGQKRNRVHLYRQPFEYPIRACDWTAVEYNNVEVLGQYQGADGPADLATLNMALNLHARKPGVVICKHCRKVAQGKRQKAVQVRTGVA